MSAGMPAGERNFLKLIPNSHSSIAKPSASKLYLKYEISFLEYLNLLLHEDQADVTQYHHTTRVVQTNWRGERKIIVHFGAV
jgi:hypothetical protein